MPEVISSEERTSGREKRERGAGIGGEQREKVALAGSMEECCDLCGKCFP